MAKAVHKSPGKTPDKSPRKTPGKSPSKTPGKSPSNALGTDQSLQHFDLIELQQYTRERIFHRQQPDGL